MGRGTEIDTGTISASRPPDDLPQGTVSLAGHPAGTADSLAGNQILAIRLGTYVNRTYEPRL
jgi:hypothetical protein